MNELAEPFDVTVVLAPVRRSMGLVRLGHGMVRGLVAGIVLGLFVLSLNYLTPIPRASDFAVLMVGVGLFAGLLWSGRRWPSPLDAARAADRYFGLEDRLTTALEYRTARAPLAQLQRSDTAQHIVGLPLKQSCGRRFQWPEVGAAAVAVALFGILFAVGTPSTHRSLAASPSDVTRIHRAALHVPALVHATQHGLTPEEQRSASVLRLQQALARLQRQLLRASTRASALRAISATQQQLHRIAAGLHPISPRAANQLSRALGRSPGGSKAKLASSRSTLSNTTRALNRMANSLSHLNAAQRAALARRLARAANQVSDGTMRSDLHQAASSLAYNDSRTASSALQRAASTLAKSPVSRRTQASVGAASSGLDALKQQVSGLGTAGKGAPTGGAPSGKSPGQGSGQGSGAGRGKAHTPGAGKGQGSAPGKANHAGSGQGSGRGTGSGQGNGQGSESRKGAGNGRGRGAGTGTGQGRGSGQSSGSGSGAGSGGTGGHGPGGGQGNAGPHGQGRYTRVYAPGHQSKGPQTVLTGPNGQPLPGSFVPYRDVLQRYAASAHQALGRGALPPSLQAYVRQYFSSISH